MKGSFYIFLLLAISVGAISSQASDSEFLRRPPLSTKCQKIMDKQERYQEALHKSQSLIEKCHRLAKSLPIHKKHSRARINYLKIKVEIQKVKFESKYKRLKETLILEGCPTIL